MIYTIFISGKILRPVADSTYKVLKTKRVKNRFKQVPFYKKTFFLSLRNLSTFNQNQVLPTYK